MFYLLTDTDLLIRLEAIPSSARGNDPAVTVQVDEEALRDYLPLEQQIREQQTYLSLAAHAAYSSFNPIDQRQKFVARLHLTPIPDTSFNFNEGSSSGGLAYTLALFEAWWRLVLNKTQTIEPTLFATGEILSSGGIRPIDGLAAKIDAVCKYIDAHPDEAPFLICYPQGNSDDNALTAERIERVKKLGGDLNPASRVQELLAHPQILGSAYDGDPSGRWTPFQGLSRFKYEDSVRFFGRERDILAIDQALNQEPRGIVIVSGPSGSGKSSLLQAGLIPHREQQLIEHQRLEWIETTPAQAQGAEGILQALLQQLEQSWGFEVDTLQSMVTQALEHPETLITTLQKQLNDYTPQVILLIDQYEERYTQDSQQHDQLITLLDQLNKALKPLHILIALRQEYAGRLGNHPVFKTPNQVNIAETLLPEEWHAIIEEQALYSGIGFETLPTDWKAQLEIIGNSNTESEETPSSNRSDNSVTDLAQLIVTEAIQTANALPMVEFLLEQLYLRAQQQSTLSQTLRFTHYLQLGGLKGAIGHAAETLLQQNSELQLAFPALLRQLVTIGENDESRASACWMAEAHFNENSKEHQLQQLFLKEHLLILDEEHHTPRVRLTHEALLTHWSRAKNQIEEDRTDIQLRTRLEHAEDRWSLTDTEENQNTLLLQDGLPLNEAEAFLNRKEAELDPRLINYIQQSRALVNQQQQLKERRSRRIIGSSIAVAVIMAVLAGMSWVWKEEADESANIAQEQTVLAEQKTIAAKEERDRANKLLNFMMYDLRDKLKPIGKVNLLEDVAKKTTEYYESFNDQNISLGELFLKAEAYHSVGNVSLLIGKVATAYKNYQRALEIIKKMVVREPDNSKIQRALAVAHIKIADVQERSGEDSTAFTNIQHAAVIMEKLVLRDPNNSSWQITLAGALSKKAYFELKSNNYPVALQGYQHAVVIMEKMVAKDSSNISWQNDLGTFLSDVGEVQLLSSDEGTAALKSYQRALVIREKAVAREPDNSILQHELAKVFTKIGNAQQKISGESAAAQKSYQRSLEIMEKLVNLDPDNSDWQRNFAATLALKGEAQRLSGEGVAALKSFVRALESMEKLVAWDLGNRKWNRELLAILDHTWAVQLRSGEDAVALKIYQRVLLVMENLVARDPGNSDWQRVLSAILDRIGAVHWRSGEDAKALKSYLRALENMGKVVARDPSNSNWQRALLTVLRRIQAVQMRIGQDKVALKSYQRILVTTKKLVTLDPNNSDWRDTHLRTLRRIGKVQLHSGETLAALESYQRALEIMEKLVTQDPNKSKWQRAFAVDFVKVGEVQQHIGNGTAALISYQRALEIMEKLVAQDPENQDRQRDLGISHIKMENAYGVTNYKNKIYHLEQAIEHLPEIDPLMDQIWGYLGRNQLMLGDFKAAQESSRKADALNPKNYEWGINLAHSYLFHQHDIEKAKSFYLKVLPLIPDDSSFKEGPIADFKIFTDKGLCNKICQQAKEWLIQEWKQQQQYNAHPQTRTTE